MLQAREQGHLSCPPNREPSIFLQMIGISCIVAKGSSIRPLEGRLTHQKNIFPTVMTDSFLPSLIRVSLLRVSVKN